MVHPLGDYACQPSDSSVVAHSLTACYYINGAAYTNGATQIISNSVAKVRETCLLKVFFLLISFSLCVLYIFYIYFIKCNHGNTAFEGRQVISRQETKCNFLITLCLLH